MASDVDETLGIKCSHLGAEARLSDGTVSVDCGIMLDVAKRAQGRSRLRLRWLQS